MLWSQNSDWSGHQNGQKLEKILLPSRRRGKTFAFAKRKWRRKCGEGSKVDRLLRVAQPLVFGFWPLLNQPLWVHQDVWLPRLRLWSHPQVCHLTFFSVALPQTARHHPLWSKTGKHLNETKRQVRHCHRWLRLRLCRKRDRIYLYPVKILQSTRYNAWCLPIHTINRYVEPRLYFDRAFHRFSTLPRNKRAWVDPASDWCYWNAKCFSAIALDKEEPIYTV